MPSPSANPVSWYVTANGKEQGPFSSAQMRSFVQQGKIAPTTLVRRDGMTAPVAAAKVQGLLQNTAAFHAGAAKPAVPAAAPPADSDEPIAVPTDSNGDDEYPEGIDEQADENWSEEDEQVAQRATIVQRIIMSLLDMPIYGAFIVAFFFLFTFVTFAPIAEHEAEYTKSWQGEFEALRKDNSILAFERIIGEGVPELSPAMDAAEVRGAVEDFVQALRDVPLIAAPSALADEVIYAWRENQGIAAEVPASERYVAIREAPITDTERVEVEQWRQYIEYVDYIKKKEGAYRESLKSYLNSYERKMANDQLKVQALGQSILLYTLILLLLGIPVLFLYPPLCEKILGATPGKLLLGYRVATLDNRPVGLGAALLRHLCRLIPFYFVTAFRSDRQALHELLTKTQVIGKQYVQAKRRGGRRAARSKGAGATAVTTTTRRQTRRRR